MAKRPHVAVEPRKDGQWAVQTDGTQRADSLHDRKADAVERGRELAGNKRTELVIKSQQGQIRWTDSHGNDPRHVIPSAGRWAVRKTDSERATKIFDSKEKAVEFGRDTARKEKSELIIHTKDGRISARSSYRNEPRSDKKK